MAFAAALFIRAGTRKTGFLAGGAAALCIMGNRVGWMGGVLVGAGGCTLAICVGTLGTSLNRRVMFSHRSSGELKANPFPVRIAMSFLRVK